MILRVTIHEDQPALVVKSAIELEQVLLAGKVEARQRGMLNCVAAEAENGNKMWIVLGGEETVLSFNYAHGNLRYYASKGATEKDGPVLTCYVGFHHHTEFPRRYVIPIADGIRALQEFRGSGELPASIQWLEV